MSLRAVHLFVISVSVLLLLFFGLWAIQAFRLSGDRPILIWGTASLVGGIALIPYMVWFVRKTKNQ